MANKNKTAQNQNGDIFENENNPKVLWHYVQEAAKKEEEMKRVQTQALRALSRSLGAKKTFAHRGKLYQIRERGGEPYLVEMNKEVVQLG